MARATLKKDFRDGDKLYGQQLNNNFGTIEAALDAMNKIAWQDDPDESVTAFRGTTEQIQSQPIIDGQLLYDISTGETYTDYNGERVSTGSGNAIHIGTDTPENEATQLWIDPTEDIQSATEIESGSNANGNWLKFADGTLIQYGEYTQSSANTTTALPSGGYRSSGYNVDFPIEFYEIPGTINVVSSGGLIDNGVILANANTTKTYFQILWWSVSAVSTVQAHKATWIAIGRWK